MFASRSSERTQGFAADPDYWKGEVFAYVGLPQNLKDLKKEREILIDNLLVRVQLIIEMSRPALRHGSLNSLFQVALYLPS